MPTITRNRSTNSVIFYNRGVPTTDKNFASRTLLNYSILKQLAIYNRNNGQIQGSRSTINFLNK